MLTHLAPLVGWLARALRHPSAYAQVFALTWLGLLLWQRTSRLRAVQAAATAGALDLCLHVLAWAGMSLWLSAFPSVLAAADVGIALTPIIVAPFVAVRLIRRQPSQTEQVAPATVGVGSEVAGAPVDAHDDTQPAWALETLPVARVPAAASAIVPAPPAQGSRRSGAISLLPLPPVEAPKRVPAVFGPQAQALGLGLSVIVPVYNERATVMSVVARVLEQPVVTELILVDDGSTDGTSEIIMGTPWPSQVCVLRHPVNQGKGAAIRTGVSMATQGILIIQDADLEYDPRDYPRVLQPIWEGRADVVYGSRFLTPRPFDFWLDLANRLLTLATNVLYGTHLTDMETCYKAFRAEVLKGFSIRSNRFDFEPEITARILRQRRRIVEVPISYTRRGKKIQLTDAFAAIGALVRFRFAKL